MTPKEILGVDVGTVRIGVARASSAAKIAQPLTSLQAQSAVQTLKKMADEQNVSEIVVGLPRSLDGRETAQTKAVRQWVAAAKKQINAKFYWQDEALTSRQAAKIQTSKFKLQT